MLFLSCYYPTARMEFVGWQARCMYVVYLDDIYLQPLFRQIRKYHPSLRVSQLRI